MCYAQRFLAWLGFLAIILLPSTLTVDRARRPSPHTSTNRPRSYNKAMKDALAAYKQAADMVKACPAVIARSIDDCADVCALFNVTKKDVKDHMDRLGKITLDIEFPERGRDGYKEMVDDLSPVRSGAP